MLLFLLLNQSVLLHWLCLNKGRGDRQQVRGLRMRSRGWGEERGLQGRDGERQGWCDAGCVLWWAQAASQGDVRHAHSSETRDTCEDVEWERHRESKRSSLSLQACL